MQNHAVRVKGIEHCAGRIAGGARHLRHERMVTDVPGVFDHLSVRLIRATSRELARMVPYLKAASGNLLPAGPVTARPV
jgi:hypothetical protein